MTGLYARQAEKTGWLGLVGYLLLEPLVGAHHGLQLRRGLHPAACGELRLPAFVQAWMGMFNGPAGSFDLGVLPTVWTLTGPVYILGGLLFGIATFRAGILPRWAGALLALSTVLAPVAALLPNASQPKIAIPMGIALAWLGYALWSEQSASAAEPVLVKGSPLPARH